MTVELPTLHEKLAALPANPGVYLFKDAAGKVIYVGKAANLRSRVRSYFQESADMAPRIRAMVERVTDLDFWVADSEVEALILECNLIKHHRPRYNVRFRDDKRYPYLKITVNQEYPQMVVVRRRENDQARYFGPFASTYAMWETIRLARRVFGLCLRVQASPSRRAGCSWQPGQVWERPCLDYHLGCCLGPCVRAVSPEEYRKAVDGIILFLEGRHQQVAESLRERMDQEAARLNFEAAARLRDKLAALERATAAQKAVLPSRQDADVIGSCLEQDTGSFVVLQVRDGKLIGQQQHYLEGVSGLPEEQALGDFLALYYHRAAEVPGAVHLPGPAPDLSVLERWLSERRGGKVRLAVPVRGEKRRLVEMAIENAQARMRELQAQEGAERARAEQAVGELQQLLGLPLPPERIEAYDISTIMGQQAVGSMVVMEQGLPRKSDYRRFKIRVEGKPDDFAMMREILERRLRAAQAGASKFARLPDLLLVDGGKGQLGVAVAALHELGMAIPAAALAKEHEHIFVEGRPDPIILPGHSRALHLLQRVRDEAHRFAHAYHQTLRARRSRESALDQIPGIGPVRKRQLLAHFGSLARLRRATLQELEQAPGMTRKVAEAVWRRTRDQG